jgi:cytochrome oxidase Cu insertion factor (SCO1/SenC/PrrC family)
MIVLVVLFAVGAIALLHRAAPAASPAGTSTAPVRATGIPDTVSTSVADLMGLSPVPTTAAPPFTLTDQAGRTVSLESLRGHPVVLEFMDPNCVDICPIVSQEFVDAAKDLGPAGRDVVFLGINVNPFHTDVASMATYSKAHGLDAVATWHFLTGPSSDLAPVWGDYNVTVSAPNPSADVIHTSVVYFIDPAGQERYVAFPMVDHKADGSSYLPVDQTASWGRGIALVARSMD